MKATGIVRRIDDLGRVVIPKEIRRTMRIREGEPFTQNAPLLSGKGSLYEGGIRVPFIVKWGDTVKHSMFLHKKNLKFFCCSFEKNVLLRMCIQQQMRMFSMSH